ncbi:DNA-binding protein inhibitor ID-2 [Galemys pyrenaicus]|uniref:DNA-binding protein inhibitor ID-2 n=1 Tax=Galemys pyrenaicus TaxID=202257 RepID=A0A8J6DN63_GALPY|nr:DNA-binding protein inhibitor ID-2 [Galemys pyrenaicus]
MKAFSPVRSVRKNSLSDHSLGISRSKTPVDDPMSLLYNMNDCYSKLKELVPSIPQNKKVSKMEILQHVIDYILDLQIALDSHPTIVSLHHQRPGQSPASRTPLTTLNTDISILSLQAPHRGKRPARASSGEAGRAVEAERHLLASRGSLRGRGAREIITRASLSLKTQLNMTIGGPHLASPPSQYEDGDVRPTEAEVLPLTPSAVRRF